MGASINCCQKCGAELISQFEKWTSYCRLCLKDDLAGKARAAGRIVTFRRSVSSQLNSEQFTYQGKKYSTCGHHLKLRAFLNSVVRFCQGERIEFRSVSLFCFREDFRRIIRQAPIPSLIWCLLYGKGEIRQLVIWLFGRIRNRRTANVIYDWGKNEGPAIRKETAKALRRMGAWGQLRELGEREQNPRVLAYVMERATVPFDHRLGRFVENVRQLEPIGGDTAPVVSQLVASSPLDEGKPPKSEWMIGTILQRIRRFVMKGIPASVAKIRYRPQK